MGCGLLRRDIKVAIAVAGSCRLIVSVNGPEVGKTEQALEETGGEEDEGGEGQEARRAGGWVCLIESRYGRITKRMGWLTSNNIQEWEVFLVEWIVKIGW